MCPPTRIGWRARSAKVARPDDALRLADHVVVEQQEVVALVVGLERLVHRSREPARAAEVALLDHVELVAEALGGLLEVGVVLDPLVAALVDDVHRVEDLEQAVVRAEGADLVDAVVRPG